MQRLVVRGTSDYEDECDEEACTTGDEALDYEALYYEAKDGACARDAIAAFLRIAAAPSSCTGRWRQKALFCIFCIASSPPDGSIDEAPLSEKVCARLCRSRRH